MRHLTAWLEDGYCSITVANHQLITVIRFISKIYIRPWNDFANRLHLVLHVKIRLFVKFWFDPKPNAAYVSTLCSATFSVPRRAENLHGNCLYNPLWSTTDVSWWLATSQLPHRLLYLCSLYKHFIHLSILLLSFRLLQPSVHSLLKPNTQENLKNPMMKPFVRAK